MSRNNEKQHNIECVLQTAYNLFLENGIENTTKEMLTRASGLSRSSIDRYFKNKTDCVLQTAEWVKHNVRDKNIDAKTHFLEKNHTGFEYLQIYMELVCDLLYSEPKLFVLGAESRAFVFRNNKEDEIGCERYCKMWGEASLLVSIFELGVKDGSIISNINPQNEAILTRESLIGFLTSIAISQDSSITKNHTIIELFIKSMLERYKNLNI